MGGELKQINIKLMVFDSGRLLVVRVGNLKRVRSKLKSSRGVKNPLFIHEIWGASIKPPWPKPSLGKKDQVREKSTPKVTSIWYKACL